MQGTNMSCQCIYSVIVYILDSSSDMVSCEELCHASVFMVCLCTY